MLNWNLEIKKETIIQKQLFVDLDEAEQLVYDFLLKEGKQLLDVISLSCKLPVYKIVTILFNLEMKGVVKPLPGKMYEAI